MNRIAIALLTGAFLVGSAPAAFAQSPAPAMKAAPAKKPMAKKPMAKKTPAKKPMAKKSPAAKK